MSQTQLKIDLSTFFLSISSTAMMHMGVPFPGAKEAPVKDLEVARQNIALLELMKEKTTGNRSQEEDRLIDELLFQLRMRFLEATRK